MEIVLDNIIFQLQHSGGISVVWYELLSRLLRDGGHDVSFLDNPHADNPFRRQLAIDERRIAGGFHLTAITRGLPVRLRRPQPFIFHSSYYRYCTSPLAVNITTLHDFTNELFNSGVKKRLHTWQKFRALRHSRHIVCISENTKRDLMAFLPDISEERISVIHNGVSDDYHPLAAGSSTELPFASGSYVLFVGNRAEYKNFRLVCRCLRESSYSLVIVGPQLSEEERGFVESSLPPARYKSLGFVANSRLNELYNHAACLAYPSSYEGFGLPILEAQKAGCPVIACGTTSVPEVCGESPLLMQRPDDDAFMEKLRLVGNGELRQTVVEAGKKNASRFTWDAMYQGYTRLYSSITADNIK